MGNKKKLSGVFPNHNLMTARDCMTFLGWTWEPLDDYGAKNIMCCGQLVRCGGWVGTEHMKCNLCGKGMQDVLGVLPAGRSTAGILDPDDYEWEEGKQWIPENFWL
uniref:Uncharacterized protein n=1 Tax=viral metagenome TaxID=1070528 RepID=A0A6M3LIT6_9ZZZZ